MLGSIILLLIIYKTSYASKSLVWVWGVTHSSSIIPSNMAKRTQPKKKKNSRWIRLPWFSKYPQLRNSTNLKATLTPNL